jgi:hypothetical protein
MFDRLDRLSMRITIYNSVNKHLNKAGVPWAPVTESCIELTLLTVCVSALRIPVYVRISEGDAL